jgi:hypothetical protein
MEVTVLGDRGKELSGWEKAYFTANETGEWLQKNCLSKQRNKHCFIELARTDSEDSTITGKRVIRFSIVIVQRL